MYKTFLQHVHDFTATIAISATAVIKKSINHCSLLLQINSATALMKMSISYDSGMWCIMYISYEIWLISQIAIHTLKSTIFWTMLKSVCFVYVMSYETPVAWKSIRMLSYDAPKMDYKTFTVACNRWWSIHYRIMAQIARSHLICFYLNRLTDCKLIIVFFFHSTRIEWLSSTV